MEMLKHCGASKKPTAKSSERGIVLVLTLMILAIITAMVVEFAYGVYTTTSALYNWRDSQRLSFVAKSGTAVAVNLISSYSNPLTGNDLYKYLGRQIPLENVSEGFKGRLIMEVDDENSKFNLNSLVYPKGQVNDDCYHWFKNLLDVLNMDQGIADKVAYWIDPRSEPGMANSENSTKNVNSGYMDSIDELLLIKGIDRKSYERLLPYVTVYGYDGTQTDSRVNINTASIPVIMSLGILKDQAEEIVNYRNVQPFGDNRGLQGAGLDSQFISSISGKFTWQPPKNFRITSIGEENKIRRVIESVIRIDAGNRILYWQET